MLWNPCSNQALILALRHLHHQSRSILLGDQFALTGTPATEATGVPVLNFKLTKLC